MIQYTITNSISGAIVADFSQRVQNLGFASTTRGMAECTGFIPMQAIEAFGLYDAIGILRVRVVDSSSGAVYDGRVEDVAIAGDGVTITALGYSRALSDAPYTALWSDSRVSGWAPITTSNVATRTPERYQMDTNNRLFIAPQKNATYANTGFLGEYQLSSPDGGARKIIGVSFDYEMLMPANWQLVVDSWSNAWAQTVITTINASGALQTGGLNLTFAGNDRVGIGLYYNAVAAVYAGETGANYLKITNVRVVTSTANRINTTLGTAIAAGTRTVTPGSMARIYIGQNLQIGGAVSESVTVTAITGSTFTAVFAQAHLAADTVQAHVIYADEIADDLIAATSALNSSQLSSSLLLTNSPALDLGNETYQDRQPADILDYLAGLGDSAGNKWEWGVDLFQRLYFRQQSTANRTWYIEISDLNITRVLDQLTNSVYAVYADASGRALRTAPTSDPGSVARYGLTRRVALAVSTTSAAQAGLQQAVALGDGAEPKPQSGITIDRVFDGAGQRWPLWYVQAGDTVVIFNLSPTISIAIDRIRSFRLARAEYQFDSDTLTLEPETPLPSLDALLAKIAAGVQ